jgi:hypothetical protein
MCCSCCWLEWMNSMFNWWSRLIATNFLQSLGWICTSRREFISLFTIQSKNLYFVIPIPFNSFTAKSVPVLVSELITYLPNPYQYRPVLKFYGVRIEWWSEHKVPWGITPYLWSELVFPLQIEWMAHNGTLCSLHHFIFKELNRRRRVYVEIPEPSRVKIKCS